jgi:parvulin-like peptidyl-prolyl isomerase
VLLALGAALGLALAAAGLLSGSESGPPDGAIALVNGVPIRGPDYARLVAGLESDLRRPADDAQRRRVLDRMIEEELLVQRALALGLARHDRRVRADLVSAMIAAITADVDEREPTDAELRAFYAEEGDFFVQPGRIRVRQVFFRVPSSADEASVTERARQARRRLVGGEPFDEVTRALGDEEILSIPDALLPAAKLREYLGPTALRATLELQLGEISQPVRSGTGIHLLQLVDREPSRSPPYDEIAEQVRNEWTRRAGDRALRDYLDELRVQADVDVAELPR